MQISKKLLELRTLSGKSQAEFARLAGVSQRTWSSYESGQTTPKMGILWTLAAKGYTIPGLTTNIVQDMIDAGKLTEDRVEKVAELARSMPPETPAGDKSWGNLVEKAVKTPAEEIALMSEVRLANLESKIAAMDFRLTHIETLLQQGQSGGGE